MESEPEPGFSAVKSEQPDATDAGSPKYSAETSEKPSSPLFEEQSEENDDSSEFAQNNQIVLYEPRETSNDDNQVVSVSDPSDYRAPLPQFATSNSGNRVLPSVGAFTVQCALCFKWRLIPTKEKYEEIRAHILEEPFVCQTASAWRNGISCEDPGDIEQDGSRLWAIDKPSIAQPPPGWQRLLRIRGEGSTRFADVYYAAPSGKKLRSMVEVDKYLLEHPEYVEAGVTRSQFSFQIPKPLQENYVRKRPNSRLMQSLEGPNHGTRPLEPEEVRPISWAGPASDPYSESQAFESLPPAKRKATNAAGERMYDYL